MRACNLSRCWACRVVLFHFFVWSWLFSMQRIWHDFEQVSINMVSCLLHSSVGRRNIVRLIIYLAGLQGPCIVWQFIFPSFFLERWKDEKMKLLPISYFPTHFWKTERWKDDLNFHLPNFGIQFGKMERWKNGLNFHLSKNHLRSLESYTYKGDFYGTRAYSILRFLNLFFYDVYICRLRQFNRNNYSYVTGAQSKATFINASKTIFTLHHAHRA